MTGLIRSIRATFWVARIAFRFFSGRPMSGDRKTDATFWRPATMSLDPSHTALRWEMMRGASRAAWRIGVSYLLLLCLLLPLLLLAGRIVSLPWYLSPSFLGCGHLLLLAGGVSSYALRRAARNYGYALPTLVETEEGKHRIEWRRREGVKEWRREKVLPLARSASIILGQHIPERKAHEWVTVPRNYQDGGWVEIRLPASFPGDAGVKKRLTSAVSQKLGIGSPSAVWQTEGSSPRALFAAPPVPPSLVSYSDVEELLRSTEEYRPLLGLLGNSVPLHAEMIDDSPHIAVSAGPGAGKSTLAKLVMMQALRWGWGIVVLDWKQTEAYSWLGGLEGVTYLTRVEQIHDMGVRIAEEIDIRKANGLAGRAKVLVVRDEWNVTADLLQAYWQDLRATAEPEEKRTMPLKSPALRGYATLDYAGREYGLFDFCIAQRFSARIFNGNADIRECFQIKLLARYSAQTVKMLAPDIKPFPRKNNTPGRWAAVVADEVSVIQVPFITNEQARQFAIGGQPNPICPLGLAQRSNTRPAQGNELGDRPTPPNQDMPHSSHVDWRKLSDMVEGLASLGVTLEILRHASKNDSEFPLPKGGNPNRGYLYDTEEIRMWARARHARTAAERRG